MLDLKAIFDYQRMEQDPALQAVIDEVLDRYTQSGLAIISDDVLSSAAGGLAVPEDRKLREPKQ